MLCGAGGDAARCVYGGMYATLRCGNGESAGPVYRPDLAAWLPKGMPNEGACWPKSTDVVLLRAMSGAKTNELLRADSGTSTVPLLRSTVATCCAGAMEEVSSVAETCFAATVTLVERAVRLRGVGEM